jgi:phage terminase small subunit
MPRKPPARPKPSTPLKTDAAAYSDAPAKTRGRRKSAALLPPMTAEEQRFVTEYLVDFNEKQAARRALYPVDLRYAWRVMKRPAVAAAIDKELAKRRLRAQLTADRVLQEYARIAFADIRRIADFGSGHLKVREGGEMSDDDAAAIAQVTPATRGGGARVRLYDKKAALDAIARHLGLFSPPSKRHPQTDDTALPEDKRHAGNDARLMLRQRLEKLIGGTRIAGANGKATGHDDDGAK